MRFFLLSALLLTATAALADSPAALSNAAEVRAEASFKNFVEKWMQKVRDLETKHRSSPRVVDAAASPLVTYRGYADDYSVELRPTGYPRAPYVGLLHYTELVYSCRTIEAESCQVASSVPVTEIFRYRNGRWSY